MYLECTDGLLDKFTELIEVYPYERLLAEDLSVSQSNINTIKNRLSKKIKKETSDRIEKLYKKYNKNKDEFLKDIELRADEIDKVRISNQQAGLKKYFESVKDIQITRRKIKRKTDGESSLSDSEVYDLLNGKYLKQLEKGKNYIFNKKSDLRGTRITFNGKVEEEYPRFYLIKTDGIFTTILKNDLYTDEYEVKA